MTVAQGEQGIIDALNAQLQTIPNIGTISVLYLGTVNTVEADTPYLATSLPAFRVRMLTVGQPGIQEWSGTFQVAVYWPLGQGTTDATTWMAAIRALFPYGLTLGTAEGWMLKFLAPTPEPLRPEGAYLQGIVRCPWILHEMMGVTG